MKKIIYIIFLFSIISCNNDDLIDTYNSKNKSEKLFGRWTSVDNEQEEINMIFNSNEYIIYSTGNENSKSKYVWFNDDDKIYYLRNGNGSSNDSQSSMFYLLNNSNDTLKLSFGDNIWETYYKNLNL